MVIRASFKKEEAQLFEVLNRMMKKKSVDLNNLDNQILTDGDITLVPITQIGDDLYQEFSALYRSSSELQRYHNDGRAFLFFRSLIKPEDFSTVIKRKIQIEKEDDDVKHWVILDKEKMPIGIFAVGTEYGNYNSLFLSYTIIGSQQGKKYATKSLQLVLDFIKKQKGVEGSLFCDSQLIRLRISPENIASIKVAEKNGFKQKRIICNSSIPFILLVRKI